MGRTGILAGLIVLVALVGVALAASGGIPSSIDAGFDSSPETDTPPAETTSTPAAVGTPAVSTATPTATRTPTPTDTPTPTPTPADPDRDNLPTRYEESIGTDPMHKTVLLAVEYTGAVSELSAGDRSFLRAKFEELKVVNPDGTTGVTLQIVEEWRTDGNATVNASVIESRALAYHAGETKAEPCRHHYLVIGAREGHRWGIAATGGWTSIVKSDTTGFSGSREDVIVHELLHNLVGKLDPSKDGVLDDRAHTTAGWLQPKAEMGGPSSLHPASRATLNERGFANIYSDRPRCV